jgi:hypothetical protein
LFDAIGFIAQQPVGGGVGFDRQALSLLSRKINVTFVSSEGLNLLAYP